MAPQFNLLKSRFEVGAPTWVYGSKSVQGGLTFIALTVRGGALSCVERRRVKGVILAEFN